MTLSYTNLYRIKMTHFRRQTRYSIQNYGSFWEMFNDLKRKRQPTSEDNKHTGTYSLGALVFQEDGPSSCPSSLETISQSVQLPLSYIYCQPSRTLFVLINQHKQGPGFVFIRSMML